MTSATNLNIKPEDLPVHQINVVGVGLASDSPVVTDAGIQLKCSCSDYFTKDRSTETQIVLFHPHKSRLKNQVTTVKRGSSIFFSGALTSIENQFYLELHNFNFVTTSTSTKNIKEKLPWSSTSSEASTSTPSGLTAQTIHQKMQEQSTLPEKREVRRFQPNKVTKLADLSTHALEMASTTKFRKISETQENPEEIPDKIQEISEEIQEISEEIQEPKSISRKRKTRSKKN